jgi:hypothetical protein
MIDFLIGFFSPENIDYNSDSATIIGVFVTAILAGITIYLTVRDKQKTKSLNELEKQTELLSKSYFELIMPKLGIFNEDVRMSMSGLNNYLGLSFRNYGNYGINFRIDLENSELKNYKCSFSRNLSTISPNYEDKISVSCESGDIENKKFYLDFYFEDVIGRKFKQTLVIDNQMYISRGFDGIRKKAEFKPPELLSDK